MADSHEAPEGEGARQSLDAPESEPRLDEITLEDVKAMDSKLLRRIAARFLSDDDRERLGEFEVSVLDRESSGTDEKGLLRRHREFNIILHDKDPHDKDPHDKDTHGRENHSRENHSRA